MLTSIFRDEAILRKSAQQVMYIPDAVPIVTHLRRALDEYHLAAITPQNLHPPDAVELDDYLLSVMVIRGDLDDDLIIFNPYVWGDPVHANYEGCASIETGGRFPFGVIVRRPAKVYVEGYLPTGDHYKHVFTGDMAAYIMHEYDHLRGRLIVDHVHEMSLRKKEAFGPIITVSVKPIADGYLLHPFPQQGQLFEFDMNPADSLDAKLFDETIDGKRVVASPELRVLL